MLYVYFGNDVARVRQQAFDFLETLTTSAVESTLLTADRYQEGIIHDLAKSTPLFGGFQTIILDTLSEDEHIFGAVMQSLEMVRESANSFVMIEGTLKADDKRKINKLATAVHELTSEKKERFNAFLLADAFVRRDKKSLWLLLTEAWKEGFSNEEIIGILLWQVKILRLVDRTKTAEEAEQKPFVYNKAKRALAQFKKGELDRISRELLTIYHDGHAGKRDARLSLEGWVLSL